MYTLHNFILVILFLSKNTYQIKSETEIGFFPSEISSSFQTLPKNTFTIVDNISSDVYIGHLPLTEKEAIENYQLLFGKSNFRNIVRYLKINDKGEIISIHSIDRDSRRHICGPLQCCDKYICLISFEVLFVPIQKSFNPSQYSRKIFVQIQIIDTNENRPKYSKDQYNISVIESNQPAPIILPEAVDIDSKFNGIKSYSIDRDYNGLFQIYTENNLPKINITRIIDYENEQQRSFHFKLYASDDLKNRYQSKTNIVVTVIDTNDNTPHFPISHKSISIFENRTVDSIIYKFKAIDKDSGDNAVIFYSLSPLSFPASIYDKFKLDKSTGYIKLIKSIDYENFNDRNFKFVIIGTDNGKLPLSSSMTLSVNVIDLNDNPPEVKIHMNKSIVENSDSVDKVVLSLSFIDRDEVSKNQVKCLYENAFGLKIVNIDNGIFQIAPTKIFDAEQSDHCWIGIKCTDSAEPVIRKSFNFSIPIVDVNDNYPKFNRDVYYMTLEENIKIGSRVLKVTATDLDISDRYNLKYFIIDCNLFNIDSSSGSIFTIATIDREEIEKFEFHVQVIDSGNLKHSATVSVRIMDVNDNKPTISSPLVFHVKENCDIDKEIGKVQFEDKDKSENGSISYRLIHSSSNNPFELTENGRLIVKQSLDREKQSEYLFIFLAYDHGTVVSMTTTATGTIIVTDENDNAPVFIHPSYNSTVGIDNNIIYYNTPSGDKIITIKAVDSDLNLNSKLKFAVIQSNMSEYININEETGEVYFQYKGSCPNPGTYEVVVQVVDGGQPQLMGKLRFFVVISDKRYPQNIVDKKLYKQRTFFSNIVIFSLIIVFSTALISTLVAVVVWVRSKQSASRPESLMESPDLCNYLTRSAGVDDSQLETSILNGVITENGGCKFHSNIQKSSDNENLSTHISPDLIFIDQLLQPTTSDWTGTILTLPISASSSGPVHKQLVSPLQNILISKNLSPHNPTHLTDAGASVSNTYLLHGSPTFTTSISAPLVTANNQESTTRASLLERRYPQLRNQTLPFSNEIHNVSHNC